MPQPHIWLAGFSESGAKVINHYSSRDLDLLERKATSCQQMNHLAHIHLSAMDAGLLVGNLSADYLNKRECLELPLKLQDGVTLHRHIDHQTDNHPAVRECWALLRPKHGKYASVIFDIYCDYLLASRWDCFSQVALHDVANHAYKSLASHADQLPDQLAAKYTRMIQANWLTQYGTYEGQASVFERFAKRLSKPALLMGVFATLRANEAFFADAFDTFYPWMQASCAEVRSGLTQRDNE